MNTTKLVQVSLAVAAGLILAVLAKGVQESEYYQ